MEGGRARLGSTLSSRPQPSKSFKAAAEHATGWAAPARPPARPWRGPLGGCGGPRSPLGGWGGPRGPSRVPQAWGLPAPLPQPRLTFGVALLCPPVPLQGAFPPSPPLVLGEMRRGLCSGVKLELCAVVVLGRLQALGGRLTTPLRDAKAFGSCWESHVLASPFFPQVLLCSACVTPIAIASGHFKGETAKINAVNIVREGYQRYCPGLVMAGLWEQFLKPQSCLTPYRQPVLSPSRSLQTFPAVRRQLFPSPG